MGKVRVALWPPFVTAEDRDDVLCRVAWYLYPWRATLSGITYFASHAIAHGAVLRPHYMDAKVAKRLAEIVGLVTVREPASAFASPRKLANNGMADRVLLWNREGLPEHQFRRLRSSSMVVDVDRRTNRYEGSYFLRFGCEILGGAAPRTETAEAKSRFAEFARKYRGSRFLLAGTGPSLSAFKESGFDFSCVKTLAVNSMVKDVEFLARSNAIGIAACDPIFHAGCSRYAERFRGDLLHCLERLDIVLFVVSRDYEQYLSFLPDVVHGRIIPLAAAPAADAPNLDLSGNLAVTPTHNVLTLALLPIAATLAKEILIVGCDGRPAQDNQQFWTHDRTSQYTDEMIDIRECHPAFFAIDYEDYYDEHCRVVDGYLADIESNGTTVRSLTPSHIPALAKRCETAI